MLKVTQHGPKHFKWSSFLVIGYDVVKYDERVQLSHKFDSESMVEHNQIEEDTKYQNSLMEFRDGSVDSSSSSQSDCEQELRYETDPEIDYPCSHGQILGKDSKITSPAYRRDCLLPNKMVHPLSLFLSLSIF
ncbi:hypothetical protein Ancab_038757 [Ancistrocladus abbreviatus]